MIVVIWVYHKGAENARSFSGESDGFSDGYRKGVQSGKVAEKVAKTWFFRLRFVGGFSTWFSTIYKVFHMVNQFSTKLSTCFFAEISSRRENFGVCAFLAVEKRTFRTRPETIVPQRIEPVLSMVSDANVRFWVFKNAHFSWNKSLDLWAFLRKKFVLFVLCAFCALFFRLPPCVRARIRGTWFLRAQNARYI